MTYSSKMVLHKGEREIQLLFLGRGHTGGDTVVFLPKERIVCTGDLMESRLAYMGDAFFDEWVTTLGELKKLDFDDGVAGTRRAVSRQGLDHRVSELPDGRDQPKSPICASRAFRPRMLPSVWT